MDLFEKVTNLLQSKGERYWTSWIRESASRVKNADARGLPHFLGAFGGMGSILDDLPQDVEVEKVLRRARALATEIRGGLGTD